MAKQSAKRAKTQRSKKQQQKRQLDDVLQNSSSFSRLTGVADVDETADLEPEDIPRRFKQEEEAEGLPIIVNGEVRRVKRRKVATPAGELAESGASDRDSDEDAESRAESEAAAVAAAAAPAFEEFDLSDLKERIALYADLIMAEPEQNLAKLRELMDWAEKTKRTKNRQVVLLSLLVLFKSIIPGYHIKELTEAQQKEKASKEVRELRDYEQGMLAVYRRYVHLLHHSAKQGKTSEGVKHSRYVLGTTATEIACDLVETQAHFNYRHELLVIIIDKLSSQKIDAAFNRCIKTLVTVFEEDNEGHVSFEAVQALAKMIKTRRYKVDSRVISVLIHLRLLTELTGRADLERMIKEKPKSFEAEHHLKKKDRVHLTKSQRKARKEQKEIDEEMRKAELGVSAKVRERLQSQTLKLVFVLYMNILKVRSRTLLGATLEGLARFAHLINADLYGDLLEVLREILNTTEIVNTRQSLLCILTAFELLKGQGLGQEQNTDLGFFVDELYATLNRLVLSSQMERSHKSLQSSHAGKLASETDLLVRCLELLFIKRRGVSRPRLLAFTKRLAECSLQFPERSSLVSLKVMREMVKQHPEAAALLTTDDRVGRGKYNYEVDVPELANAEVATIWEVALLKQHYDPRVQQAAKEVRP